MIFLGVERELLEQPLYALKPLITLDRQVQRPGIEYLIPRIEEGDHRSRLAKMAPGRLDCPALPSRLLHGNRRIAAFAECYRAALLWRRGCAYCLAQVTALADRVNDRSETVNESWCPRSRKLRSTIDTPDAVSGSPCLSVADAY